MLPAILGNIPEFAFIDSRNAFRQENLLLVQNARLLNALWVRSDQVLRDCPQFVRYTTQVSDHGSVYYARLCELLDLAAWDSAKHLKPELELGIANMKLSHVEDQTSASSYIFHALSSIAHEPRISFTSEACPEWIRSILRLPIFPVRNSDGQCTLQALGADIFVPDSDDLKDNFQGKRLDFGEHPLGEILPVLRCSDVTLKYTSEQEPSTMEVERPAPVNEMSSDEANDIMHFINTWAELSADTFGLSAKDDALASSSDTILSSGLKQRYESQMMTEDDDEVEMIEAANIRSGFAGEYFVSTFRKLLILDLSETGRSSSRVFDEKLDQLPQTLCPGILTMHGRVI
jgi:hypothetical protein